MTRIGFIREVVEKNGGTVGVYWANGPGGMGGFSLKGPNRNKVIYKVEVCNKVCYANERYIKLIVDHLAIAEQLTGNNGIERVYFSNGHMRVVFSELAPRFKR